MVHDSGAAPVAVIGSPSDCTGAVLNLRADAFDAPLLGKLLHFSCPRADGSVELALGTVTSIQTVNPDYAPTGRLALHIAQGHDIAAAGSDTRGVAVKVEAVFRSDPDDPTRWFRHSSSLSNSPRTGTEVFELDQATADELMADNADPAFLGTLRGTDVQVPFTQRDFSGPRGSLHSATLGQSGSGKSVFHSYVMAADLRYPGKGHIVLDPQGQWASELGMPFSLQGLAAACGRKVTVARISQSLRLRKDAPLFLLLLAEARWFRNLAFGAGADENVAAACRVFDTALRDTKRLQDACGTGDWTAAHPHELMRYLLDVLYDVLPTGTVYAGREQSDRVQRTIYRPTVDSDGMPLDDAMLDRMPPGALDPEGSESFAALAAPFATLHSLWSPYTPAGWAKIDAGADPADLDAGDRRRDAWGLIRDVLSPQADRPAPWLILDLSADLSHFAGLDAGDSAADDRQQQAARLLDDPDVKARIMRQLMVTLELVGQQEFSRGRALNVQVDIDEAHRWEGSPDPKTSSPALVELSALFARLHREVRKFGIGFASILQTATGLNEEIFKQLGALYVGYGLLDTAELKRLGNRVSDAHMQLYRATPPPEATGRYTWMLVGGGLTGLSFGHNPVTIEAFTDPGQWLAANASWITALRREFSQHLPAGDAGGALRALPGQPTIDGGAEAVQQAARRRVDGRGNAAAVAAAARAKPRGAGKEKPASAGRSSVWATVADDDEPPF